MISREHLGADGADCVGQPSEVARAIEESNRALNGEHRGRLLSKLLLLAAAALSLTLSLGPTSAMAAVTHVPEAAFGPDGTAGTSFAIPSSVAVDQTTGDIYVIDAEGEAVYKFSPNGTPVPFGGSSPAISGNKLSLGSIPSGRSESQVAIDPTNGDFYVTSRAALRAFDSEGDPADFTAGSGAGTNEIPGFGELLGVAVDSSGAIYAADYKGGGSGEGQVSVYAASGEALAAFPALRPANLAVNAAGVVDVSLYGGGIEAFQPSAFPVTGATSYSSGVPLDPGKAFSVAVDSATGDIYATQEGHIAQMSEGGTRISTFASSGEQGAPSEPVGIGVNHTSGKVVVSDFGGNRQVTIFGPAVTVPTISTGAATDPAEESSTLHGSITPEGAEIASCAFEYGQSTAYGALITCAEPASSIGSGSEPVPVHAEVGGLTPARGYHARLVVETTGGARLNGNDVEFHKPAVIVKESTASALGSSAEVSAIINPEGLDTEYFVEYGTSAAYGLQTPVRTLAATSTAIPVEVTLAGLEAGQEYHYRFVAKNGIGRVNGPDTVFKLSTFGAEEGSCPNATFRLGQAASLPDCRAYELVSPVDKNGADITTLGNLFNLETTVNQSAVDGNALTYSSYKSFAGAVSGTYSTQYLSRRSASGWNTEPISPREKFFADLRAYTFEPAFRAFSSDLETSWVVSRALPTLAPGAVPGVVNVYRRSGLTGTYTALTTAAMGFAGSPEAEFGEIEGISGNERHTVISTGTIPSLHPEPSSLYDLHDGLVSLVSVLPSGEPTTGSPTLGYMPTLGRSEIERGAANAQNAVSDDGSLIYWTDEGEGPGPLYLRVNDERTETVSAEPAAFRAASADGQIAWYETGAEFSSSVLHEFSAASETQTVIANRAHFAAANPSGSYLYFVSEEALGGAGTAGSPNLYVRHNQTNEFIATLAPIDAQLGSAGVQTFPSIAGRYPLSRTALTSHSGTTFAFQSTNPITGFDNRDLATGERDSEVFVYDAVAKKLRCISCASNGASPEGQPMPLPHDASQSSSGLPAAAWLTTTQSSFRQTGTIAADGARVFFNSFTPLVPRDVNGQQDVYEWEEDGIGNCERTEGCVSLISSGQSAKRSQFVESDNSGANVFFTTSEGLLSQDPGAIDIYDARELGGFPPVPPSPAGCEGESCQAKATPPAQPGISTSTYTGPGNPHRGRKGHRKHHKKKTTSHSKHAKHKGGRQKHRHNASRNTHTEEIR